MMAGVYLVSVFTGFAEAGFDAHAYWSARPPDIYADSRLGTFNAYLYSPAFAQLISPLTALPWPAFVTLWSAFEIAALLWLAGPFALALIPLPPVFGEIHLGNIHLLTAAAIVLGFRWPATWAFVLLTKVTPGIGLLWFAVRREWRSLGIALGATVAIAAVSFVLAPSLWFEWLDLLRASGGVTPQFAALVPPVWVRLPIAAAVVAWGASTDRRWTVPVAATIAMPVLWGASLTVLIGCIPLLSRPTGVPAERLVPDPSPA